MSSSKHDSYFTTILLLPASSVLGYTDVPSAGSKGYDPEYPDSAADYTSIPVEGIVNGINHPDLGFLVFDPQSESAVDGDATKEQPMSEESLRESLKKQLEFCFSRWVVTIATKNPVCIPQIVILYSVNSCLCEFHS